MIVNFDKLCQIFLEFFEVLKTQMQLSPQQEHQTVVLLSEGPNFKLANLMISYLIKKAKRVAINIQSRRIRHVLEILRSHGYQFL